MTDRAALVTAARNSIAQGSKSFAAASRLFAPATRERAWLLYAWCRAADDITDGQEWGHGAAALQDPAANHAQLVALTETALDSDRPVPIPFAALRQVARETAMPGAFIADHLAGFALDATGWQPQCEDDLLRYCYHVAGVVGCMMAWVMDVEPDDEDTFDRACDLGIAFQLANIARDVIPDAAVGRCYLPGQWLAAVGLSTACLAEPAHRSEVATMARRLVELARPYRQSARIGAARLPLRSRLAVLAAEGIYGEIGETVLARGEHAWDARVRVRSGGKLAKLARAALLGLRQPAETPRSGLWTRPPQS
jgi:phytoene synthase